LALLALAVFTAQQVIGNPVVVVVALMATTGLCQTLAVVTARRLKVEVRQEQAQVYLAEVTLVECESYGVA
jgi:UTP-glucose-1-phosphate uridylyltransferase